MTTVCGSLPSLPVAYRDGYVFAGWYDSESGGNPITVLTKFTGQAAAYAVWTTSHRITFDGTGGTPSASSMATSMDGTLLFLPTATKDGRSFEGWYTQAEGG